MYECHNPVTDSRVYTQYMGEADFWASLDYFVFDHFLPIHGAGK